MAVRRSPVPARAVALVLHGGAEHGAGAVRPWGLAYLRMVPFARALRAAGARHGLEVRLLRNRLRGWNEPALDPVRDARWALERVHAESPGLPVVLVGHSMGGRVALRVADDPAVTGVCALAPWTPQDEPVESVRDRTVVLAHGTRDAVTSPEASHTYARRAQATARSLARFEVAEEGHAMVRRPALWQRLVVGFTADVLGFPAGDGLPASAWDRPVDARLRIPL
ncbi:alpha/beta hydrolase [Prauserella endophytica]|uniref:Alpha/beta hydrolase n=1 Tax=Prauserella endophytica TaxID=1592324 RepID=A0ABY2S4A3_9PSEU|nr:alpha/beta fold hydrolase [Prauserella endophytica]TKG70639.1 alpha/beta hydrolase [Prauserella endophytica]